MLAEVADCYFFNIFPSAIISIISLFFPPISGIRPGIDRNTFSSQKALSP